MKATHPGLPSPTELAGLPASQRPAILEFCERHGFSEADVAAMVARWQPPVDLQRLRALVEPPRTVHTQRRAGRSRLAPVPAPVPPPRSLGRRGLAGLGWGLLGAEYVTRGQTMVGGDDHA